MMGLIGMGNNPMAGPAVSIATIFFVNIAAPHEFKDAHFIERVQAMMTIVFLTSFILKDKMKKIMARVVT